MKTTYSVILFALAAFASEPRVESPVLGYSFDSNASVVRAVLGIPGASLLSSARSGALQSAWPAPGKAQALGATAVGRLILIDLMTGVSRPLTGEPPDRVTWSPNGETAALLLSDGRIRLFSGGELSDDFTTARSASAFAVSDDGLVLVITHASNGTELHAVEGNADTLILSAPGLTAVAFFRGSRDAVVADGSDGKVYLLKNAAELKVIGDVPQGSAIGTAGDPERVLVASRERRTITTIQVANGIATTAECGCVPESIDNLSGGLFRITGLSDGPMWLFNAGAPATPFVFVPQPEARNE